MMRSSARLSGSQVGLVMGTLMLLAAGWLAICVLLPFGNHMASLIAFSETRVNQQNLFERVFLSKATSRLAVRIRGVSRDAPVLTGSGVLPDRYLPMVGNALSGALTLYQTSKGYLTSDELSVANLLIVELINACRPDVGPRGIPPLVDAIFTREPNFVTALLNRGASPHQEFLGPSGVRATPRLVAERLKEKARIAQDNDAVQDYERILALIAINNQSSLIANEPPPI